MEEEEEFYVDDEFERHAAGAIFDILAADPELAAELGIWSSALEEMSDGA